MVLSHRDAWTKGNHEDGFLVGLDSLIGFWADVSKDLGQDVTVGDDAGKLGRRSVLNDVEPGAGGMRPVAKIEVERIGDGMPGKKRVGTTL